MLRVLAAGVYQTSIEAIEKVEINGNGCKLSRIAKQRQKDRHQISGVNYMKDKKGVGKVTG